MKSISVVVSVFNEEKRIEECLQSASLIAQEIIVIDHYSTDKTYELAKKFTKHVFREKNNPLQIDLQKNMGFEKATKDWIFCLDADERITQELASEIKNTLSNTQYTGFQIPRKNIIFNKWIKHSLWWPDFQLRLFQKGKGKYTNHTVHKQIEVDGEVGQLENPLVHQNYQTISQYLLKLDLYTSVEAEALIKEKKEFFWQEVIRRPVRDFLKTFFLQQGYKDGFHGFVLSSLQAFYMLITYLKVWEKKGFSVSTKEKFLHEFIAELRKLQKEVSYWVLTSSMTESSTFIKNIPLKIRRKYLSKKIQNESE